jgi:DNA-binding MarR family transcriptional regulator
MKQDLLSVLENHQQFQKTNMVRIVRQSVRSITHEISRSLARNGHVNLSARHLNVFENLCVSDNNIMTLASRAGISKQAMSKLVKEVSAEGYVKVITDKRDSRLQIVTLTDKGGDFVLLLQKEALNKYQELLDTGTVAKSDVETVCNTLKLVMSFLDGKPNPEGGDKPVADEAL